MADFAFWLEIYNDILSCLYTSQEIFVEPQDSSVSVGSGQEGGTECSCPVSYMEEPRPSRKSTFPLWT